MGLFSTLTASDSTGLNTSSPSLSVPTLVQLYTKEALTLDPNVVNAGTHAVLSYQAIDTGSSGTEVSTQEQLFGHSRITTDKTTASARPDLGIWNCRCQPVALADHLLKIPKTPYFCFKVDLTDPSLVEPTISVLHEALIRLLISTNGASESCRNCTTTLYDLKSNQFGLAAGDDQPTTTVAPEEGDRKVHFGLILCATLASQPASQDGDYQKTQAQHLVWYHLRRYAAALNATLCLVQTDPQSSDEDQEPTLSVPQVTRVWRDFADGNSFVAEYTQDGRSPIYGPDKHHEDLIESVLLRNAQCPGHWDAAKESLWVALPPTPLDSPSDSNEKPQPAGDDSWLSQLQQSMGVTTEKSERTHQKTTATASATPKKDDDTAVSSFFENLMKK